MSSNCEEALYMLLTLHALHRKHQHSRVMVLQN